MILIVHILEVKIILLMMMHKIIWYFNELLSILKELLTVLTIILMLIIGKLNAPGTNRKNDQTPIIQYNYAKIGLQFSGDCLKQNKVAYNNGEKVNIYIIYRLRLHTTGNTDFTIKGCLFGAVELTKNSDPDKYNYEGYGICFDSRGSFTHPDGDYGLNIIIFGCYLSNSNHANDRASNILILGRSLAQ